MSRLYSVPFLILFLLCFSCSDNPTESIPAPPVPADMGDGWPVASVSDEGLEAETITWMSETVKNGNFGQIHGILIVRNGKLIFEAYYGGYHVNRLHPLASVTKSIVSILIGIAVDRGYIADVDNSINEYFPEYSDKNLDPRKQEITIKHLLTMSACLDGNLREASFRSLNWIKSSIKRPLSDTPGKFCLQSQPTHILSGIITRSSGKIHWNLRKSIFANPLEFLLLTGSGILKGFTGVIAQFTLLQEIW